jgi:glycosyltransferase involved in cell wall biosynthesis
MDKPKETLLIFSQCFVYGGSERLMQSIYKSKFINENYNVIFSYSYFKDYKQGIERDSINQNIKATIQPLYLLTNGDVFYKIDLKFKNRGLRYLLKSPLYFFELILIYKIYNYIYLFYYMVLTKPTVLHINNGGYPAAKACNLLAVIASYFKKTKVIYQINGKTAESRDKNLNHFDTKINNAVDVFLTHSNENKEALIERGFNASKATSFPSYFEETIVQSDFDYPKKNEISLCVVGFLSVRKGQMYLLKALLLIKEKKEEVFYKLHLNVIGGGNEYFALNDFILENNLEKTVTLLGERSDYIHFIKQSDIFILPSVSGEDLPLVLIAAMQNQKCIIASKFAGIGEHIKDGFNGLLVLPDTNTIAAQLADAIIKVCTDNELKLQLELNVLETFNTNFSESKYINNLLHLYNTTQ